MVIHWYDIDGCIETINVGYNVYPDNFVKNR